MPYNSITDRGDVDALIPEEELRTFLGELQSTAAALNLFRRVPVGREQVRFPILSALPIAYWVNGDSGLKQTTEMAWANKFLNIEEIATIFPIPENVLDDSSIPIWDEARPYMVEAAARLLDQGVFFGAGGVPASFPQNVVAAAVAAGNAVARGTSSDADGGVVGDHGLMLTALEGDGYDAGAGVAVRSFRGQVRQARNVQGDRFAEIAIDRDGFEIDAVRYVHPMRGLWPTGLSAAELIAFDPAQFVIGVRQDVTWKLLTEAVITDNTNAIIYNLPQQDMVAMRMKMRVGWQVGNPINYDQPNDAQRYPAAVLRSPAT